MWSARETRSHVGRRFCLDFNELGEIVAVPFDVFFVFSQNRLVYIRENINIEVRVSSDGK